MSIRTTSGRSSSARATPSAPSEASPTTSMSSWTSRKVRRPAADHLVVVDQQHADRVCQPPGTSISIVVPFPGAERIASRPPSAARSRMETRPRWRPRAPGVGGVEAVAVVGDLEHRRRPGVPAQGDVDAVAPECRRALCRASWATRSSAPGRAGGAVRSSSAAKVTRAEWARSRTWIWVRSVATRPSSSRAAGRSSTTAARSSSAASAARAADLLELALGAGRVAVDEGGGGLGGQAGGRRASG